MPNTLEDMLAEVTDEASFIRFLHALRKACAAGGIDPYHPRLVDGVPVDDPNDLVHHFQPWETPSTVDFLRSSENWASRGDFADSEHFGEPMLRRIATMLYVGGVFPS